MYKKQVKLQRIICLALLILSAVVFVYSLGIMTDLYDSLYSTYRRGKTSISGAEVYMDMQGFNQNLLHASIGLILLAVLLFVTNTQSRRRYYIGNYCAIGLFSAASVALSIWAHGQIETFKAQWLTIDFTALAENAVKKKTLYTESTFWFDIHYMVFGLTLLVSVLLVVNMFWKIRLMNEEKRLLAAGKAVSA